MAKTKKKTNGVDLQKQAAEQYKKDFIEKMKRVINSYADEDVYSLIPSSYIEFVYIGRAKSFKFVKGEGQIVPKEVLSFFTDQVVTYLKKKKVEMNSSGNELSVFDYHPITMTLSVFNASLETRYFKGIDKVRKAITAFIEDKKFIEDCNFVFVQLTQVVLNGFSNFTERIYWLDRKLLALQSFEDGIRVVFEIHSATPEKTSITVDGIARPAIRLGWTISELGLKYLEVDAGLFRKRSLFGRKTMPVYIQSHALNRLNERLDWSWLGMIHFFTYEAFINPVITHNDRGETLVELDYMGEKVGYLVVDVIDQKILIRTFLFITNNGTPEGKRLEEITGLKKLDKKYLAIDKMSTFIQSDIADNPETRQILIDANCQPLIDLYEKNKEFIQDSEKNKSADFILKFLSRAHESKTMYEYKHG